MENIPYLFLCDYDLTLFNTKERSPNGIGLAEGHEYAVREIFGSQGLIYFLYEGGLRNRAPSEVVASLVKKDQNLIEHARKKHAELNSSSPDLPLAIRAPWNEACVMGKITEMLVYFKLQLFLGEICPDWPLPFPGVREYFQIVQDLREKEGLPIYTGILSSGHTNFIGKTFSLQGIPCPEVMVTDDDIRPLGYPKDPKSKVKPAPFPFRFLQIRWLKQLNGNTLVSPTQLRASLLRIMYFGDDPLKDGGLARNVGVPFGWFNAKGQGYIDTYPNPLPDNFFSFSSWNMIVDFLTRSDVKKMFQSGIPLKKIFSSFV